ncbi:hypothetical protein A5634_14520 [Mycobacterium asiaticum]|uniref:DUF4232 domain-containing protein n=1 Tax=Mycobacterium asiaticum TaxID=1790 RepID=A0A1A3PAE0_MYCAS|nr:hypothetical protein A5634_14520 [Mycobacterium asiaticum]
MSGARAAADPGDPAPCSAEQVSITVAGPEAAVGHRAVTLVFAAAPGVVACTLSGYPQVEAGTGASLVAAQPTLRGYMGGLPNGADAFPTVTLSPSQRGESVVEALSVDADAESCPTAADLRVVLPGATDAQTVTTEIASCQLQVHPVTQVTIQPGSTT